MSRCFPFPPPGYEKKPTTDDLDLLKKEKRKEKKHKKDKKDKEKKEGKEKREKDRSESKHKEKKDKKDKHRDKKKDKDKGKTGTTTTQDEGYNGEKVHHNNEQIHIQDKKQSLQFRNGESHKDRSTTSSSFDEKQPSTQFQGQNGDLARNRDTENFKFVQELDRRIRDEEKGTGSHQPFVEGRKNSFNNKVEMQNAMARNKINGATPPLQPPLQPPQPPPQLPPLDNKSERKMQESDDRRGDKRKSKDRDKKRAGREKDGEKEKKEEKLKERSERDKHKHMRKSDSVAIFNNLSTNHMENSFQGVGSEGILKKRKDLESNGVLHENEARPNKMARPISNISPENGRKLDFPQNPSSSLLDSQSQSQRASQNNFKMGTTKSQKVNGMMIPSSPVSLPPKKPPVSAFNHVHHKPSPIKSPPPPPPVITKSPPVTTKPPPPPLPPIPAPNSVPTQPPVRQPVSRPKPPPAVVKAAAAPPPPPPKKKAESVKPPHPDTKYLNQILTVPKPDEWGGVDEQEWLLRPAAPPPPAKAAAAAMAEVQVWSEAKHIDSVDVCALPYVIPY